MLSFFATSRVSGLASIVTAMKFSKMSAGPEPPCEISGGGGIFYPINSWPIEFRLIFWKKPLSDKNTFKLILFLVGNGCSPWITYEWILTSTYWDRSKTTKQWEQIKLINADMEKQKNDWFYFDMFHKIHLYFNGNERKL